MSNFIQLYVSLVREKVVSQSLELYIYVCDHIKYLKQICENSNAFHLHGKCSLMFQNERKPFEGILSIFSIPSMYLWKVFFKLEEKETQKYLPK